MRRVGASVVWLLLTASAVAMAAESPQLMTREERSLRWQDWLEDGPTTVVLLWASWAPGADQAIAAAAELADQCTARGLRFLVVDVHESMADARPGLEAAGLPWLHDRSGAMLKHLRVTRLPAVVVVSPSDEVVARLAADAEALHSWEGP